ncbi:MAG: META domain-containing protein [Prevotellaceae bacterium]|nr:META domain-containing protein [Prevotellaceae bacterium]
MKKVIFITSLISLAIVLHSCKMQNNVKSETTSIDNSSNNTTAKSNLTGTYSGVIPCADCDGISVQLSLAADNTYNLTQQYLKDNKNADKQSFEGTFSVVGNTVTLNGLDSNAYPTRFKLSENSLTQLDLEGNVITGALAQNYVLAKTNQELINKYWKLVEIHGNPVVMKSETTKAPHIIFKEEDNRVSGHLGCNSFAGTFQLKQGNRIVFSNLVSTKRMCLDGESMEIEKQMSEVLNTADSYSISGNTLILNRARMSPLAKFEAVYMQ